MNDMKGIIIVNPSRFSGQEYQAERIKEELGKLGVKTEILSDAFKNAVVKDGKVLADTDCDFAVFLDKDKYLAATLSASGVRLFNRAEAIRLCDDKGETVVALSDKGLNLPETVFAPLCYREKFVTAELIEETVAAVKRRLGFPVVVKEGYGSMGTGVFLVENEEELVKISYELALKPHIYQKYLGRKKGTDVRVTVIGGKAVAAIERTNACDFRSNLAQGGSGRKITPPPEFISAAERAAEILGLDYCGVDILYGDNGEPFICEVNSNAFFKGTESVTGVNVAGLYAAHIVKETQKRNVY